MRVGFHDGLLGGTKTRWGAKVHAEALQPSRRTNIPCCCTAGKVQLTGRLVGPEEPAEPAGIKNAARFVPRPSGRHSSLSDGNPQPEHRALAGPPWMVTLPPNRLTLSLIPRIPKESDLQMSFFRMPTPLSLIIRSTFLPDILRLISALVACECRKMFVRASWQIR